MFNQRDEDFFNGGIKPYIEDDYDNDFDEDRKNKYDYNKAGWNDGE